MPPLRALATIIVTIGTGAGCTFLVSFDDMPEGGAPSTTDASRDANRSDGSSGASTSSSGGNTDAGSDASADDGCDRTYLDQVSGCGPTSGQQGIKNNGRVCASYARFDGYPRSDTRANDIVTCFDQKASCITHCPNRCAQLPEGFSDECDPCLGRSNGVYCGSDINGWPGSHGILLITCSSENMIAVTKCANACNHPAGASAKCQ